MLGKFGHMIVLNIIIIMLQSEAIDLLGFALIITSLICLCGYAYNNGCINGLKESSEILDKVFKDISKEIENGKPKV